MMFTQPTHYFLASGEAEGFTPLNAFDQALLAAGVGDTNLVRMSSILPPACRRVQPFRLPYGALVPVAYASVLSSRPGEVVSAAVAVAVPLDPELPGLIMEHQANAPLRKVLPQVREMVVRGMQHRNREIADVIAVGVEHLVEVHGAAFAGVVLWNGPIGDAP